MGKEQDMKINESRNDDLDSSDDYSPFTIINNSSAITNLVIPFGREIVSDASKYFELIKTLYGMPRNGKVTFLLGGNGGDVDTGTQICHAMQNCPSGVDVVVHSDCYSMHSLIALAGKSLSMQPCTMLMFHNYSTGYVGKGNDIMIEASEYDKNAIRMLKHFCYPFLTEPELRKIHAGQTLYIKEANRADLKRRIKRHF